jgi:deoxyadenosine/deoxycytidine kinase
MVYRAAIIGCHGVGKTTLAKKLEKRGFKIFDEGVFNKFIGVNSLLSELNIIMNRLLINKSIKEFKGKAISDRCTFIDALIYTHGFVKLGWLKKKEMKIIYSIINNIDYNWVFPELLICMTNYKEIIKRNIKNRDRSAKFKETDEDYLNTIYELYNDFFLGSFNFPLLKYELREKINRIPKIYIRCESEVNDVIGLVESTNNTKDYCLK